MPIISHYDYAGFDQFFQKFSGGCGGGKADKLAPAQFTGPVLILICHLIRGRWAVGNGRIETTWLRRMKEWLSSPENTWTARLPTDHNERVERMRLSLDGLGLGDALGEMLSYQSANAYRRVMQGELPAGPGFMDFSRTDRIKMRWANGFFRRMVCGIPNPLPARSSLTGPAGRRNLGATPT